MTTIAYIAIFCMWALPVMRILTRSMNNRQESIKREKDMEIAQRTLMNAAKYIRIKTLPVVGQEVHFISNGVYYHGAGTVVEITREGVVVQAEGGLLRFDNNGVELDVNRRDRLGFGPSPEDKFHTVLWHCAPEFQPLELAEVNPAAL